jgi:hypothetical protein
MLHEFAVDPWALASWQDFRYVVDQCGVEHGRLIAEFPEKWKQDVYHACRGVCNDVQLTKVVEKLSQIKGKLSKLHRAFDNNVTWLLNAETAHLSRPFHAILASENPRSKREVLLVEGLTDDTPLWRIPRQVTIPRTASDIAQTVRPLFEHSSEVLFVEPNFDATEERFRASLHHFGRSIVSSGRAFSRIELHLLAEQHLTHDQFRGGCQYFISRALPTGLSVRFIRWRDFEAWEAGAGGRRLHPRFVLTDIGGILFEWGLDEGPAGDQVDVFLLENETYLRHWQNFQVGSSPFEFVDDTTIVGTG